MYHLRVSTQISSASLKNQTNKVRITTIKAATDSETVYTKPSLSLGLIIEITKGLDL